MGLFYVILEGGGPRFGRYDDWHTVSAEVERLAKAKPDQEFIILKAVQVVGPHRPPMPPVDPFQHLVCETGYDIPR
ncbi:hypothetical protein [Niveispirillum cyanobacteriorum]|uniref:Uncharacterized protein n=1 Tax=Niveispirillum cyanobacteriorum TaxID=1612173 RepID=A0A2K9NI38_9PROT|nr:hypothetical protein [Niveispirillum cyanobacteriorum]AUN31965.1 hypothetical protein C0V82_16175 [Niveispirillum cyanobacteriorum]GGE85388.1 hypothetical protein GCM10011317_48200 [Niveispirillum cyanobacteriorum]